MDEEYISTLTQAEKMVFLRMFCKMIKADGVIDQHEIQFLKTVAERYGVAVDDLVQIIKDANLIDCRTEVQQIKDRKIALELIKELCVLANIDDNTDDGELDLIIDVAQAMGIEDEKVLVINRWVLDSLILSKTGRIVMEKE